MGHQVATSANPEDDDPNPPLPPLTNKLLPRPVMRQALRRITVTGQSCHQSNANPTTVNVSFTRTPLTDEQPVMRRTVLGREWAPLETLWLEDAGMVFIKNEGGDRPQGNLTDKQKEHLASLVVEVAFLPKVKVPADKRTMHSDPKPADPDPDDWTALLLLPGETLGPLTPINLKGIRIRCLAGQTRICLTLFPV